MADKKKTRIESDSIGEKEIDGGAYYGVQSLRGAENFPITGVMMHRELIKALAQLKKAAAMTNRDSGRLEDDKAEAIIKACDEIIDGKLHDAFIVDAIQGGAGTSANMNANEVIANRAIELLGGEKGDYTIVHPNDHVNMAQSTNDIYPSAGKIATASLLVGLIEEEKRLLQSLLQKAEEFDDVLKMGRTQLQDAVPMRLGQEFHAYASAVRRDIERLKQAKLAMHTLNMGATAIGTAIDGDPYYLTYICYNVSRVCGENYSQCDDLFDGTSNLDVYVHVSAALKAAAVNLSKICNDLRLMSSGPKTGLAEISLPAKQNGSSIMPGKVNPVIPEVVSQVAFRIIGSDVTITMAAEAGQLELNAFEPVIFYSLFEGIQALTQAIGTLIDNCISGITANRDRCDELLHASVGIATALKPYIGYKKSAAIAKESLRTGVPVKEIVLREGLMDESKLAEVLEPKNMTDPKKLD
ncbi:MAG: aspartate ammonia-lyase [Acutalibacteraceae bacterium]